jgi:hypothetical protein
VGLYGLPVLHLRHWNLEAKLCELQEGLLQVSHGTLQVNSECIFFLPYPVASSELSATTWRTVTLLWLVMWR